MSASTEVRVPFVDPQVFRAAFTLPGSSKIRGRTQKVPLREVARDWVPHEVVDRPKASFGAPLRAWVTHDLAPLIDDVLLGGELVSSGFLRAEPLRRMVADAAARAQRRVQAAVAAADDGALVPQRPGGGGRGGMTAATRAATGTTPVTTEGRSMKQVAQNYRSGELTVLDVPVPACKPGGVLVRSLYSLISTGTELMKVSEARLSLLGKARARPDQVRKLLDSVAQQGAVATYQKAMNRLDSYTPLGYSLCGVVVEVGAGAEEFSVGQVVAAAGNEFALHAEVNWVPVNLCVPVPDGVAPEHAAFATVGAIAMQGVRRAEVALGETACVIGLGLIGQLVVRLLVASGVQVVGLDTVEERCRAAEKAGALACAAPDEDGVARVERVAAGARPAAWAPTTSCSPPAATRNGPVEVAARLARDRARVVDIGKTPARPALERLLREGARRPVLPLVRPGPLRRPATSCEGIDYPAGYVRWTERRNLACFLDLLAGGIGRRRRRWSRASTRSRRPVDVYDRLGAGALRGVGFLLELPGRRRSHRAPRRHATATGTPAPRPSAAPGAGRSRDGRPAVRLGFIGAGNYATSMLLPHLRDRGRRRAGARWPPRRRSPGLNAQRKFGFEHRLDRRRHGARRRVARRRVHRHPAPLARRAGLPGPASAGKAVFVEKPLALTDGAARPASCDRRRDRATTG